MTYVSYVMKAIIFTHTDKRPICGYTSSIVCFFFILISQHFHKYYITFTSINTFD